MTSLNVILTLDTFYNSYLAMSDFWFFWKLKEFLEVKISSDDKVKVAVYKRIKVNQLSSWTVLERGLNIYKYKYLEKCSNKWLVNSTSNKIVLFLNNQGIIFNRNTFLSFWYWCSLIYFAEIFYMNGTLLIQSTKFFVCMHKVID